MAKEHPMRVAQEMALLLQSDPIAAAQIKEFIPEDRLSALLELGDPFREEIADLEAEVSELESELANAQDDLTNREQDCADGNRLIGQLEAEVARLKEQLRDLGVQ